LLVRRTRYMRQYSLERVLTFRLGVWFGQVDLRQFEAPSDEESFYGSDDDF